MDVIIITTNSISGKIKDSVNPLKEGANWAVVQGPPQLRGLYKKYRNT